MARLISQKGLTDNTTIGSPQEGTKWVVKWAVVILHTSSTSGSRIASIGIVRANNTGNYGATLATTGNQTGTSTTYGGTGDVTNPQLNSAIYTYFYDYPEIFAIDVVQLFVALVSGDTVDYYILVEEEAS